MVEHLVIKEALNLIGGKNIRRITYNMQGNILSNTDMVCGGTVTVSFQLLTKKDLPMFKKLTEILDGDCNAWLYMRFDHEKVSEMAVYEEGEVPKELLAFCTSYAVFKDNIYMEPVSRKGRVYIFGGGHVGAALVPVLALIDFKVTVFDNRPDRALPENYPMAETVILGDYARFEEKIRLSTDDYVVVMTPGHQADFEVLVQALKVKTTYIGCIGSRKKIALTREKLKKRGFTEEEIARLHAPIGLPILAETPAEIAVSVAAELIRHRKEHASN